MRLPSDAILSYSMNVHPVAALPALEQSLADHVRPIAESIAPGQPFGVGLWLTESSCADLLESPARLAAFRARLAKLKLFAFTANAFPIGAFHEAIVKRAVYRPTWAEPRRSHFTAAVARVLAALIPEGAAASISTLPLSFKPFADAAARPAMLAQLRAAAIDLERLALETGRDIRLAIEPEPFGLIETTDEAIALFEELDAHRSDAAIIRRRLGICFDACHLACEWEDVPAAARRLAAAGIAIPKAQLSVALELRSPGTNPEGRERLRSFIEPRYLHQTIARGRRPSVEDLPEIFAADGHLRPEWAEVEALRTHFHVPIFWRGDEALHTTRPDLDGLVPALLDAGCRHFEVETYSWNVLPEPLKGQLGDDLNILIARELREALSLFPKATT